jgi:hypothetical protein
MGWDLCEPEEYMHSTSTVVLYANAHTSLNFPFNRKSLVTVPERYLRNARLIPATQEMADVSRSNLKQSAESWRIPITLTIYLPSYICMFVYFSKDITNVALLSSPLPNSQSKIVPRPESIRSQPLSRAYPTSSCTRSNSNSRTRQPPVQ